MENNTININVATGEITHSYTEMQSEVGLPIVIDYDNEVNKLIRQRYSSSQEFAILRQKDEKTEIYNEYYNYCEDCKRQVKEMINNSL